MRVLVILVMFKCVVEESLENITYSEMFDADNLCCCRYRCWPS